VPSTANLFFFSTGLGFKSSGREKCRWRAVYGTVLVIGVLGAQNADKTSEALLSALSPIDAMMCHKKSIIK
jgi:hypothetical protein